MAITKSLKLFKVAKEVMVGGVNSPVRSFLSVGGQPLIMQSGQGVYLRDVDNNLYTDYCLSWGALILGHSHPEVMGAISKAIVSGTSYGMTTRAEIDMAKFIVKHVPSIDMIRFVNSGTEATMSAIRLARGFTKKRMIVKFDGCYHGHFDDLLVKAGSGVAKLYQSSSLGIPKNHLQNTLSLPFNDTEALSETLNRFHNDIACVILEPVAGNMGVIPAEKAFVKVLRYLTKKYDIVLIFDEIMTGFRTSLGCVQSELGIIPDMTCLGKIIGSGFPVGAYGGRREIMEHLSPLGGVYQAGTFAGNPVVMRAGLATLENLTPSFYRRLNRKAENFAKKLNGYFKENSIPAYLSSYRSMASIRFGGQPVLNYAGAQEASSQELYSQLFKKLLKAKIYWPPADLESFFICAAHTQHDLNKLTKVLKAFFKDSQNLRSNNNKEES